MSRDSGGLPVGERIERLEDEVATNKTDTADLFREVFEEMRKVREELTEIKIKMAESSVKLALTVGVLSAVGSAVLALVIKWATKGA